MDISDEHYAVYFKRYTWKEWDAETNPEIARVKIESGLSPRLLADIRPGFDLNEIAFGLEPGDSRSRTGKNEIRCRYAPAGTSFSYTVKNVPVDIQLDLQVTVRGRDTVLKICCGEQEIFSEGVNLTMDEPAEKTIRLPSGAVSADGALKITFSGGDGKWSPEITRIRLLKKN